jgi:monoamine oxidase
MPKTIVIIGAGMAGLAAANVFRERGGDEVEIVICEANNWIGGRALTQVIGGEAMDWGCEALEAGNQAPTAELENSGEKLGPPKEPAKLYRIEKEGAEDIYKDVALASADGTMAENVEAMKFFVVSYSRDELIRPSDNIAYGVDARPGFERLSALQSGYGPFSESSVLGESSAFDRARSECLQPEGETVFFKEGLGAVVQKWANDNGLMKLVRLEFPITLIENISGNKVKVVPKLKQQEPIVADAVLVTVPTGIVASGALTINDLSQQQIAAFGNCPLGYYHKVAVTGYVGVDNPGTNTRFFISDADKTCLFFLARSPEGHYCMAHAAGETAFICNNDPGFAEQMMINTLKSLNPDANLANLKFYHSPWHDNEYIGGAYSYSKVDHGEAREILHNLKVGNIYFAGEACSLKWYGQLAGAMETGQAAAERMLKDLDIN